MTIKFTKKQIEALVNAGAATRLKGSYEAHDAVVKQEGGLSRIAYSAGIYGTTAVLFKGDNSGRLYVAFGEDVYIYG